MAAVGRVCKILRYSSDYDRIRFLPRPGQSDYTAFIKYGGFNDYRGGGMFSGRITTSFVMGGAIARKLLTLLGIEVLAHTVAIGGVRAEVKTMNEIREKVIKNPLGCGDPSAASAMVQAIERAKKCGDSLGGIIEGIALNVPVGLGEPIFDTLDGELARALLAIPAIKGVEFGAGFALADMKGSQSNDSFNVKCGKGSTTTNHAGGILGGISKSMPIRVRVAVKPPASIAKTQQTVDLREMAQTVLSIKGRHDTCIVPRVLVVVDSVISFVLCDFALRAGLLPGVIR